VAQIVVQSRCNLQSQSASPIFSAVQRLDKVRGRKSLVDVLPVAVRPEKIRPSSRAPTPPPAHRAQPLLLPVGQNVGKRNGAVRAAFRLFQKADGDRLGDRVARGCLASVRVAGEHRKGSDTSAATFRNCLEGCLQDPLFGPTEYTEVNGRRQVDRLLRHDRHARIRPRQMLASRPRTCRCLVR
jgi:hypothetical protein